LYDGTLSGTIRALSMKDSMTEIRRELPRGYRGLAALYRPDVLTGLAFEPATNQILNPGEKAFMARGLGDDPNTPIGVARKKIALYSALGRAD
jgi:hypothetical protein